MCVVRDVWDFFFGSGFLEFIFSTIKYQYQLQHIGILKLIILSPIPFFGKSYFVLNFNSTKFVSLTPSFEIVLFLL